MNHVFVDLSHHALIDVVSAKWISGVIVKVADLRRKMRFNPY
jgi:hypothetical protein